MNDSQLPTDDYSRQLSRLLNDPSAIQSTCTIDTVTMLGHSETWIVKTVRVESGSMLFFQCINADGGKRFVLPMDVAAAVIRQHATALDRVRKRAGSKAAATRKAKAGK